MSKLLSYWFCAICGKTSGFPEYENQEPECSKCEECREEIASGDSFFEYELSDKNKNKNE